MSDGTISKVQLPNGNIYDIKDAEARQIDISATYDSTNYELTLDINTPALADNEEF